MNIWQCFTSKFALGVPSTLSSFCPVIFSDISWLFPEDLNFFAVSKLDPI